MSTEAMSVSSSACARVPGSLQLHLNAAVQRRAAELKLQHEVDLRADEEGEGTGC